VAASAFPADPAPPPADEGDIPAAGAELPESGEDGRTAEVPVAGRLLRRSRRRVESAAAPAGAAAPASPDVPVAEPAAEPRPVTGTAPLMTRRALREQEEARRAAEQGGVSRMIRAITGSIPVVRPGQDASPAEAGHDLSTPAGRAAAWRATWGFGQSGQSDQSDQQANDTTDGENR
jgi:hypothetical protein